jgi:hypothetical protein
LVHPIKKRGAEQNEEDVEQFGPKKLSPWTHHLQLLFLQNVLPEQCISFCVLRVHVGWNTATEGLRSRFLALSSARSENVQMRSDITPIQMCQIKKVESPFGTFHLFSVKKEPGKIGIRTFALPGSTASPHPSRK